MAKYRVDTDNGSYIVETEDSSQTVPSSESKSNGFMNYVKGIPGQFKTAGEQMDAGVRGFTNTAFGGIPEIIAQKLGGRYISKQHPIAGGIGQVAGFTSGLPSMAMKGATSLLPAAMQTSERFIPSVIRGGVQGGAAMATQLPSPDSSPTLLGSVGKVAGNAVGGALGGAVLGGASSALNPFKNVYKYSKPKNRMQLVNETRDDLIKYKKDLTETFGKEYDKIIKDSNIKVDLNNPIKEWFQDHGVNVLNNEEFRNSFKSGDPTAKKIYNIISEITNPKSNINLNEVSAQEADNFRKYIENLPGIRGKLSSYYKKGKGMVDFTDNERILLDLANNIKSQLIESHPTLGGLNNTYREGKQTIDAFRRGIMGANSDTTLGNLRSYNQLPGDFSKAAAEKILRKETLKKVMDFSNAHEASQMLKQIQQQAITNGLPIAGAGIAGAYIANKLSK